MGFTNSCMVKTRVLSRVAVGTLGNCVSAAVMTRRALRSATVSAMLTLLAAVDTLVLWTDLGRQYLKYVHRVDLRTVSNAACKLHKYAQTLLFLCSATSDEAKWKNERTDLP